MLVLSYARSAHNVNVCKSNGAHELWVIKLVVNYLTSDLLSGWARRKENTGLVEGVLGCWEGG